MVLFRLCYRLRRRVSAGPSCGRAAFFIVSFPVAPGAFASNIGREAVVDVFAVPATSFEVGGPQPPPQTSAIAFSRHLLDPAGIGGPQLRRKHWQSPFPVISSIPQGSAGRSLRPAEARSSRPAGPLRARPPQAASRVCCDNLCAVCGIGPSGPAARSRPLAEGCSSTSQARPLGCELALRLKSTSKRSAGRSLRPAEARSSFPNLACSPQAAPRACQFAANRRQPATRVPQVRFERALRRLCPVLAKKRPFPKRRKARPGVPSRQRTASSLQMQKRPLPKERPFE